MNKGFVLRNLAAVAFAAALFPFLAWLSFAQSVSPVSLFGIQIGTRLPDSPEYRFVQEDETTLDYMLRNTTNPEYLIQSVDISKRSRVVVSIHGRTPAGPASVCQRMLSETMAQLREQYPALRESGKAEPGDHDPNMVRPSCFLSVQVTGMPLRVPCSSGFFLYCERQSNAFVIRAEDTEFSDLARREAEAVARLPKRNHLD